MLTKECRLIKILYMLYVEEQVRNPELYKVDRLRNNLKFVNFKLEPKNINNILNNELHD